MKQNLGLLLGYAMLAFNGETSIKEQTTPRLKENHRERLRKAKEDRIVQMRLLRGERQWFLGDTDAFVWARNEKMAQKKWKKKLAHDLKEAEKKKV